MKTVFRLGNVIRIDGDFVTVYFKSIEKEYDYLSQNTTLQMSVGDLVCVKEEDGFGVIVDVYPDHSPEEMGKLFQKTFLQNLKKSASF